MKKALALLLCCVLLLCACSATPGETTSASAEVDQSPVNLSKMTNEEIYSLAEEIFSCKKMPSNMEWPQLVEMASLAKTGCKTTYTLRFLLQTFDIGRSEDTRSSCTTIPLSNLGDDDFSFTTFAKWLSCVSACYERYYGTPIFWTLEAGETSETHDPAIVVHMTHRDNKSILVEDFVFSTEFLDCSETEEKFLDMWLNPIVSRYTRIQISNIFDLL